MKKKRGSSGKNILPNRGIPRTKNIWEMSWLLLSHWPYWYHFENSGAIPIDELQAWEPYHRPLDLIHRYLLMGLEIPCPFFRYCLFTWRIERMYDLKVRYGTFKEFLFPFKKYGKWKLSCSRFLLEIIFFVIRIWTKFVIMPTWLKTFRINVGRTDAESNLKFDFIPPPPPHRVPHIHPRQCTSMMVAQMLKMMQLVKMNVETKTWK